MLSATELEEIRQVLAHAETPRSACIDAMRVVQRRRGYVSDEALKALSPVLEMDTAELDSVATFYNLIYRKPVGEHVILLCDSVSCWITGYDAVRRRLEHRLGISMGRTTADNRYTLLTIPCLGACDRAPAMMIDETLYGPLDEEKVDEILAKHGAATEGGPWNGR